MFPPWRRCLVPPSTRISLLPKSCRQNRKLSFVAGNPSPQSPRRPYRSLRILLAGGAIAVTAYHVNEPFRHGVLAVERCTRIGSAVVLSMIDYKRTFSRTYDTEEGREEAYSGCHKRSATRLMRALLVNGGIFIKLGQHISSIILLPVEWTSTLRPLQDQCDPTPFEAIEELFLEDTGQSLSDLFSEFNPVPVGVASLAQVHVARHRASGRRVAVKVQHPHLEEFANIDMATATFLLAVVKTVFPEFEFSWLGDEMRTNLPLEMDFVHEAANAARTVKDFEHLSKTTLYIPEVISATRRTLVMEFIEGGRADDKEYLARHNIDRNRVSQELTRIFSEMTYINGWFHADPHPGNLLIRPRPKNSRSPYNFEIVLLDHGLYFEIDPELRVNYARLWLSLIAPSSKKTTEERKKYAELVGNIGPDMYPMFESVITGRVSGTWDTSDGSIGMGMLDLMPQTEAEMDAIRSAVMHREGLLASLFDLLRRVPRRVLMILKLNDLTRNLDHALSTTHSTGRIFVIVARYCSLAVWQDERRKILIKTRDEGQISFSLLWQYFSHWWAYQTVYSGLRLVELFMDMNAQWVQLQAWVRGLPAGLEGARRAYAGLA